MTATNFAFKAAVAASIVLAASAAQACVDLERGPLGTYAINDCGRPVEISYCFGAGCTPPRQHLASIGPGLQVKIGGGTAAARIYYCVSPSKLTENGCSR